MRRSILTSTVATAVLIAAAAPAFALPTDIDAAREAGSILAVTEADPVDPVNPTPPPTDLTPPPTPDTPENEGGGTDPVNPLKPPVDSEPDTTQPDPTDDTPATDEAGSSDSSEGAAEDVSPADPGTAVDPSTVTDVAEGTFTPGETAPAGHAFVETASDGSLSVVDTYRPGVQLAKTGAEHVLAVVAAAAAMATVGGASIMLARRTRA